jgi:hypothetical protein
VFRPSIITAGEQSSSSLLYNSSPWAHRLIGLNIGGLGVLTALLGFVYWQHTGVRAVPEL